MVWFCYTEQGAGTMAHDLKQEIKDLGIISIEGSGILTEKAVLSALSVIKTSNTNRDEAAEWDLIRSLQEKKMKRMQGENTE
jgi:hypothetical protein